MCVSRLKRGYKDAASHEHREPPIGHLVLIVHGIGQCSGSADICKDTKKLDKICILHIIGFCIAVCIYVCICNPEVSISLFSLRSACAQVAKKHFPDDWAQRRVEFLPCEWRTWLTLDKGWYQHWLP